MTRVFKGKDQRAYRVSVQVSFRDKASATEFAHRIDRIKSRAAIEGLSLSRRLLAWLRDVQP